MIKQTPVGSLPRSPKLQEAFNALMKGETNVLGFLDRLQGAFSDTFGSGAGGILDKLKTGFEK